MSNNLVQNLTALKTLPSSWSIAPFDEAVKDYSAGNKKILKSDFLNDGKFAIVDQGQNKFAGFTNDENLLVQSEAPYIIFGDHTRIFKYIDVPFAMGADGTKVLKPTDEQKIDSKYLYYFFLTLNIPNTGYNRHFKHLKKAKIPLPPLAEQQKIAAILDAADALRQKDQQLIDHYTTLSQSLFLDMFGDPVTNPMGWGTCHLESVCENIYGGGTPSKSKPEYFLGSIPWVTPKDMKKAYIDNSIDHINDEAVNNSTTKLIPIDSVLMVIRSGILKHTLPLAITTGVVTINQDMKAFIPCETKTNSRFLMHYFMAVEKFLLSKVRAVTADNIEFRQIKKLPFPLPPITLQNQFAERIQAIEAQKQQAQASLEQSNNLFNSLLQKAFTGELTA